MRTNEKTTEKPLLDPSDADFAQNLRSYMIARRGELRGVSIRVDCGTVELTGTVQSFHLKQLAVTLAKHVANVRRVIDDLEVASECNLERFLALPEPEIVCS